MRLFICLLCCLHFSGCQNPPRYIPSEKQELCSEIRRKVAKEIYNTTGLIPSGTGGQTRTGVKMLALAFDCRFEVDIDSGRDLLVTAVEKFISAVNSDARIHPYLANHPFEPKNIEIRIFIQKSDGSLPEENKLGIVSAIDGILKYKTVSPDGIAITTIYEESYEEALKKLESRKKQTQ